MINQQKQRFLAIKEIGCLLLVNEQQKGKFLAYQLVKHRNDRSQGGKSDLGVGHRPVGLSWTICKPLGCWSWQPGAHIQITSKHQPQKGKRTALLLCFEQQKGRLLAGMQAICPWLVIHLVKTIEQWPAQGQIYCMFCLFLANYH